MRVLLATAVLLGVALLGYASVGGVSVQGQSMQTVVNPGERVILRFALPENTTQDCTVAAVRGDFVRCEVPDPEFGRKNPERWYNLRLVRTIEKPVKPE